MRLPMVSRKKSKKERTLDTVASVAKAWGEWQLAKGAAKAAKRAPWKLIGAAAAGLAAVGLAKKRTGRGAGTAMPPPTPAYTGPVPDPNAPGAGSGGSNPVAPGAGPAGQVDKSTGASPAAPTAPTGPTPDPEAPKDE